MVQALLLACVLTFPSAPAYTGGRLIVEPVFCVPRGVADPPAHHVETLLRQLRIAQARYFELLRGLDTFRLANKAVIWHCPATPDELEKQPNGAAEYVVSGLLRKDHRTRWNCPYVYVVFYVGTGAYPGGGGARPINGGHNLGGGVVIMSDADLETAPNVQSTLQHELGHAFGLPHVDVYGYDMLTNNSIMSYNPHHHTNFFISSPTPGQLIPEDLRGLAENTWAFPDFRFEPATDVPQGYVMQPDASFPPMQLN